MDLREKRFKRAFKVCVDFSNENLLRFLDQDNEDVIKIYNAPLKRLLLYVFGMELCRSLKSALAQRLFLRNDVSDLFIDDTLLNHPIDPFLHLSNTVRHNNVFVAGTLFSFKV